MNEERCLKDIGFEHIADIVFTEKIYSAVFCHEGTTVILDHNICDAEEGILFDYSRYCETQNAWIKNSERCFRFAVSDTEDISSEILRWLNEDLENIEISDDGGSFDKAHTDNTPLEKEFEDLFAETYGTEYLNCLQKELSVSMHGTHQNLHMMAAASSNVEELYHSIHHMMHAGSVTERCITVIFPPVTTSEHGILSVS